ncbi:hypothetical protein MP638_000794 [Amoeboaphelidium occidentale]|nr:hypothetical protein MP638_000794 [Amoeboaphelidium occidentale]
MGQFFSADITDLEAAAREGNFKKCAEILSKRPDINPYMPVFTVERKRYALESVDYAESFFVPLTSPVFPSKSSLELELFHKVTRGIAWLALGNETLPHQKKDYRKVMPLKVEPTQDSLLSSASLGDSIFSLNTDMRTSGQLAMAPYAWAVDNLHPDLLRTFLGLPHTISPVVVVPAFSIPALQDQKGCVALKPLAYWISLHLCDHLHHSSLLERIDEVTILLLQSEQERFTRYLSIQGPKPRDDFRMEWWWCEGANRTILQLAVYYENHYASQAYMKSLVASSRSIWCSRHHKLIPSDGLKWSVRDDQKQIWVSPMCQAQQRKQRRIITLLLDHPDLDWSFPDTSCLKGNLLHHAVHYGSFEVLGLILEHKRFDKKLLEFRDKKNRTPLDLAIELNMLDKVKLLIAGGADYQMKNPRTGLSALSVLFQRRAELEVRLVLNLIDLLEQGRLWKAKVELPKEEAPFETTV